MQSLTVGLGLMFWENRLTVKVKSLTEESLVFLNTPTRFITQEYKGLEFLDCLTNSYRSSWIRASLPANCLDFNENYKEDREKVGADIELFLLPVLSCLPEWIGY